MRRFNMFKKWIVPFLILSLTAISCIAAWYASQAHKVSAAESAAILYYMCPMHPKYTSEKPGDCPSCGMRLVPKYADDEGMTAKTDAVSSPSGALKVSSEKQQIIGVQTAAVETYPIDYRIRTLGRVAADETKIVRLQATDGWIEEVYPNSADSIVQMDQLLAKFYS